MSTLSCNDLASHELRTSLEIKLHWLARQFKRRHELDGRMYTRQGSTQQPQDSGLGLWNKHLRNPKLTRNPVADYYTSSH